MHRPTMSSRAWETIPKSPVAAADSQTRNFVDSASVAANNVHDGTVRTKPKSFHTPKRNRSPIISSSEVHPGNTSVLFDNEREAQAKAKRYARFHSELNRPLGGLDDHTKKKILGINHYQAPLEKKKAVTEHDLQEVGNILSGSTSFDPEGSHSSTAVIGLCLDMCPDSEREERERKGDLDKYERLDGDRNQSSEFLAVKKYNRTAERLAELIRPMPVLQKTMDYLLSLLDQPYDDKFLGMYNFLWDRMRAIRMDLRMQHIFNKDAIVMLEQMIRLHIIAMHELCEYTKGEGFSEGFDAHLNIEQMNKASAELFQLYDDHRRKGIRVPSEKEFRGYYALLKLDRHPGYKVEPAELSLDLAKMPPEIRNTSEVKFARDVARACRTGNFILFFRLLRGATYLQACLMHAHFTKLRAQALASLHSGLQNNQGIPVSQVVQWLCMEGEDIEGLLEYHGFSIKNFEDAYMVKDGPFLNNNVDYETKCSHIVHSKKSRKIVSDVTFSQTLPLFDEVEKNIQAGFGILDPITVPLADAKKNSDVADQDMPDYEEYPTSIGFHDVKKNLEVSFLSAQEDENESKMHAMCSFSPAEESSDQHMSIPERSESSAISFFDSVSATNRCSVPMQIQLQPPNGGFLQKTAFGMPSPCSTETSAPQEVIKSHGNEATVSSQNNRISATRLKTILRIWKQKSAKRRELREQHELLASAALSSLSLGLPMRHNKFRWERTGQLNIDNVVRKRDYVHSKSWARLNVSEEILSVLKEKNPGYKCVCWKLIACSQLVDVCTDQSAQEVQTKHPAGSWLRSKLLSYKNEDDNELLVSSLGMSIWSKWASYPQMCCLSVIRDLEFQGSKPVVDDDVVCGANAVLFLASQRMPWESQRMRLHNLLQTLPLGSSLPLLILVDVSNEDIPDQSSDIADKLCLPQIDEKRISTFSIVFLSGNCSSGKTNRFFSDEKLRWGLKWLASESPVQPFLRKVKTRQLVLKFLDHLLRALESKGSPDVGPDDYIVTFNEALDRSIEEIKVAADSNRSYWPCPEIFMVSKSRIEHGAVSLFLPARGWSNAEKIQPLISLMKNCRLPPFAADLSWLAKGSDMGKEIKSHKLMLENCLFHYLIQISKMMGEDLAAREASIMLQTGADLQLDGLTYRIVPRWIMIFRRIFNWRLMNLERGPCSAVFVLDIPGTSSIDSSNTTSLFLLEKLDVRTLDPRAAPLLNGIDASGNHFCTRYMTELTLDDMIKASAQLQFGQSLCHSTAVPHLTTAFNDFGKVSEASREHPADGLEMSNGGLAAEPGDVSSHKRIEENGTMVKQPDRLSMLLEQCNMLQDRIDEKLAFYF